jgi:hypothetical protein
MEVPAEQAARGRLWPWPEWRWVSICGAARPLPLDLRPVLGAEAEWSKVAAGMPAGAPPLPLLPIGGGPRARVGAVLSHLRRRPFPHLWLRRLSVRGTVPLLPLHSVCSDLPPCLERLGWCASAWARRPIRASRRIQAERDAAGYGVAAAERNHCVQFDVPRCSLKTAKVIWRSLCWPYPGASADSLNPFHLQDASLRWRSLANECRRLSRAGL